MRFQIEEIKIPEKDNRGRIRGRSTGVKRECVGRRDWASWVREGSMWVVTH